MKTVIAYMTETGTTEKCARLLSEMIHGSIAVDLNGEEEVSIREADRIILGMPVRLGEPDRRMQGFTRMAEELLLTKEVGLFVCCLCRGRADEYMRRGYGEALWSHAKEKACFGGEIPIDLQKNRIDRMSLGLTENIGGAEGIDEEAVRLFARAFSD